MKAKCWLRWKLIFGSSSPCDKVCIPSALQNPHALQTYIVDQLWLVEIDWNHLFLKDREVVFGKGQEGQSGAGASGKI